MYRRDVPLACLLAGALLGTACGNSEATIARPGNFEADVSGVVEGRVTGPGVVRYLPPSEANFGSVPGYFFLADDTGVREIGITFTVPAGSGPGTYRLVSAHPMDAGTAFEVRVDRSTDDRTESFEHDAMGTLRLEAFPRDGEDLEGHLIKGDFEFSVQDSDGREVTASGVFEFRAESRDP